MTQSGTRAAAVRAGVEIKVIVEPGGEGLNTGYPISSTDPASLTPFVRPGVNETTED